MTESWRERLAPIIAEILEQCNGMTLKEKRKALRDGFPCGERKYHPYKIWLDECRLQLKIKVPKRDRQVESGAGQMDLFKEKQ